MIRRIDGVWVRRWFGEYSAHTNLFTALFGIHSSSYACADNDRLKKVWEARSFGAYWLDNNKED